MKAQEYRDKLRVWFLVSRICKAAGRIRPTSNEWVNYIYDTLQETLDALDFSNYFLSHSFVVILFSFLFFSLTYES